MTYQLVLFVSSGLLLLLLLLLLWRSTPGDKIPLWSHGNNLPSRAVVEHLFSDTDLAFVSGQKPSVRQCFLRDRRSIALSWLRRIKRAVAVLFHAHLRSARQAPKVRFAGELEVLLHFIAFSALWNLLFLVVWLRGPFRALALVRSATSLLEWLSDNVRPVPVSTSAGIA
jgi:hypothetical protein